MATEKSHEKSIDRRIFLGVSGSCAAHLALMAAAAPKSNRGFVGGVTPKRLVAQEPWGRLEQVADGVWALISTPLDGDRTTLCNGGIIAGSDGALVVESFATPEGASWMAGQTRDLTGRWPSHVVMTHFHGDHTSGLEGYQLLGADLSTMSAEKTRDLTRETEEARGQEVSVKRARMLADTTIVLRAGVQSMGAGAEGRVDPVPHHHPWAVPPRTTPPPGGTQPTTQPHRR
jgi:glyoxylase-like metal-dependent hydrolase (beta-lactamase superfamily II)